MGEVLHAVVLGIIQGITEFLPVSSSGHMVLFQKLFGIEQAGMAYEVLLHVATLIPVFIVFWGEILQLLKKPLQRMTFLLIAATLPTVIIALLFKDFFDGLFADGKLLGFSFIITGIILLYADTLNKGRKKIKNVTYKDALIVGAMQGVAIMPALSRSGTTIATSLFRGMDRETAAKFSFLLSIPAICGAATLTLADIFTGEVSFAETQAFPMIIGFIIAGITGYLSIRFMLKVIKTNKLGMFSYYLFSLGILVVLDQYVFKLVLK